MTKMSFERRTELREMVQAMKRDDVGSLTGAFALQESLNEIDRLRGCVWEFGDHRPACPRSRNIGVCDCGFAEFIIPEAQS